MGYIYCARNVVNSKCYIGQTTGTILQRKKLHEIAISKKVNIPFYNAIRKYGVDAFEWFVVLECDNGLLNDAEIKAIQEYGSLSPGGYNLLSGGGQPKMHDETKRKMREIAKNRPPMSEETKAKISKANTGHKCSEETSRKISASKMGHPVSDASVEVLVARFRGKSYEEIYGDEQAVEIRHKMSARRKGVLKSEEHKQRIRDAHLMRSYLKKAKHREQLMPTCFI